MTSYYKRPQRSVTATLARVDLALFECWLQGYRGGASHPLIPVVGCVRADFCWASSALHWLDYHHMLGIWSIICGKLVLHSFPFRRTFWPFSAYEHGLSG